MSESGSKYGMNAARSFENGGWAAGEGHVNSRQAARGAVWVDGKGAVGALLAAAGLKRLGADSRPGPSDVIVRLSGERTGFARSKGAADAGHAGTWTWNAAAGEVGSLSAAELERRLAREGLAAALQSGGANGGSAGWRRRVGAPGTLSAPSQTYVVTVFGLEAPIVRPEPGSMRPDECLPAGWAELPLARSMRSGSSSVR